MSLTDWVRWDSNLIDALFDKPLLGLGGLKLKASPLTKNYNIVGMAFDYAMRIKLLMLNKRCLGGDASCNAFLFKVVAEKGVELFPNKRRKFFLFDFREKLSSILRGKLEYHAVLSDCIILAKLESLYRAGQNFPDSINFEVDEGDVEDLKNLTSLIVPEQWIAKGQCFLNPTFGQSSLDIEGADADLIINGALIDIKTTKELKFKREYFRQLIGYYILNLREKNINGEITKLGIYFSRYGKLVYFPPLFSDKDMHFYGLRLNSESIEDDVFWDGFFERWDSKNLGYNITKELLTAIADIRDRIVAEEVKSNGYALLVDLIEASLMKYRVEVLEVPAEIVEKKQNWASPTTL